MIPLNTSATQACRRPCPSRLRRLALLLLAATAAFLSLLSPIHGIGGEEGRLPNVVLVITDDQGYGDLSCLGNPVLKTPNLDKLYGESVRLTDYHVAPTCSPTRAALLTGRWSNRTGVWHTIMGRSMLRENEVTMGQIFQDAGYATGMFGKWHLGDNYPYRPEDRGFAEVIRHGGGGVGQTPDYWDNAYFDGSYFYNGRSGARRGILHGCLVRLCPAIHPGPEAGGQTVFRLHQHERAARADACARIVQPAVPTPGRPCGEFLRDDRQYRRPTSADCGRCWTVRS
jgi:hypothetical protein